MVPSTDWPERKEPPEFSNPPKTKPKSTKEKHEYTLQSHGGEGKKIHSFAQVLIEFIFYFVKFNTCVYEYICLLIMRMKYHLGRRTTTGS